LPFIVCNLFISFLGYPYDVNLLDENIHAANTNMRVTIR